MKKAQISIQFNWIFVFIVGAITLIFFVMVIKSQIKTADYEMSSDIVKNFDTVIKSSEQTGQSLKEIEIPNVEIEFVCEPGLSFYDVGNGVTQDIPYDIIFTQKKLKGPKLLSWTMAWELPFKIATFQYLATKKTLFIFVNDTQGRIGDFYVEMPTNFSKMIVSPTNTIEDLNYDYYKVIYFEGNAPLTIDLPEGKYDVINISSDDIDAYGSIQFVNDGRDIGFAKKELLFGAIFSENSEFYECTMNKALRRLETLMLLNQERTKTLKSVNENIKCTTIYSWALEDINNMINALTNPNAINTQTMYQSSISLATQNQNLMRGKDCPLIY